MTASTPPPAARPAPLLEMRGIGRSFPGVRALDGVHLTADAGEVVALLGENGAGKSTLINVLSGVFGTYDGRVLVDGTPVRLHTPAEAQRLGIATIHQELNLVPDMSVSDNIWLGRERSQAGWVDRRTQVREAAQLLGRVGLRIDPRKPVRQFRVAEQQLIEVAKALSIDARVLIMDEPTSALADAEVRRLFDVIRALTAEGVAVVYISHRLEELEEIADRVTVLRDGRWIGTRPMTGVSRDELIHMMVGRELGAQSLPSDHDVAAGPVAGTGTGTGTGAPADGAEPRLVVDGLTVRADPRAGRVALRGVGFSVRPGEVVGLAGLMGAGRTETLEAVFGAYRRHDVGGTVLLDGRPLRPRSPRRAIDRGVALVAEDRKTQSLVLGGSVRFNTSLAALRRFASAGWLRGTAERRHVQDEVRRLAVKTPGIAATVGHLSGGNQQKVVLAKWLLTGPRVILLDEPTRGIDVGAKAEIYDIVAALAAEGVAVVVASSELPELLRMSDRIVVLCEGRVTADLDAASATQEDILTAAMSRRALVAP
ncbi:sugar ABC transporter ATP-binding protein [Isoptericola sp. NPDC057391]|uniref:sugar ABC transporter ATP-binding protein n=1 Tax=Isoptericola sp. NPDC057391 TaxID=3346117 RepID=UPI00363527E8